MFDKEYSDTAVKEKVELISYQPGLQDSSDLEAETRTITATAEASGLAYADYSASLTLSKPADARLVVKRICARLQVTIDTIPGGDTDLYCRVYVDAQVAANRLFDLSWNSTGAKLSAVDTHSAGLSTIFDLLKDGSSHTFYFFFWKAGTGTGIVVSLVQLWESVGSCTTQQPLGACLQLDFKGAVALSGYVTRTGTGTPFLAILQTANGWLEYYTVSGVDAHIAGVHSLLWYDFQIGVGGTVATDINRPMTLEFVLRSA